jgi:endonuclease/exonuclease/phosphatase family metal-dependent hydrolase
VTAGDDGRVLRLATANIQHGLPNAGMPNPGMGMVQSRGRPVDPDALGEAFAGVDVDVLALQEVDVGQSRSGKVDQATVIARATGMRYYRFAAAMEGDVRAGRHRASPSAADVGYGIALLSRHPVLAWFAHPLPTALRDAAAQPRTVGRLSIPGLALPGALRDEPRVVLAAVVRSPAGLVCIATTHLARMTPLVARRQLAQVRRRLSALAARSAEKPGERLPTVLTGDLNLVPRAAFRGVAPLAEAPTFPAWAPVRQIDHILGLGGVRAAGPAVAVRLAISDHRLLAVPVDVLPGSRAV